MRWRSTTSEAMASPAHEPVMAGETVAMLAPSRGGLFVDCTVGLGGHTRALLEAGATRVIGFDRDVHALAIARQTLAPWADRVELVHADYRSLAEELDSRGVGRIDGALADLGVSVEDIGRTLELMFGEREISTFVNRGDEYPVIMRARAQDRATNDTDAASYVSSTFTYDNQEPLVFINTAKTSNKLNELTTISGPACGI